MGLSHASSPRLQLGRPRLMLGLALLVFGLALAGVGRAQDATWRGQWRKALALYKKKQYDAACPLFASVSQAQPKNGAVWGDLGLCELKRGTPESLAASIHASRMAVRFGNENTRKSAYFNLGLASVKESLPDDACTAISAPAEAQCSKFAVVCTKSWRTSGIVYQSYGSVAFFARSEEQAESLRDTVSDVDPYPDAIQGGIELSQGSENSCASWCDGHAWQGQDSSPINKQALACAEKRPGPLSGTPDPCVSGGERCHDFFACAAAVLSHVTDSPRIAREWARLRQHCESDCVAGADSSPSRSCSVVHVDPCGGHVGVVCSVPNEKGSGSRLEASEVWLPEPEPSAP